MKINLVDTNEELVAAWRDAFSGAEDVHIHSGSILDFEAEAIVSPANSFGFMDGGIDLAYSEHFGWHVEERLQTRIKSERHGELAVGDALVIETRSARIPFLISAPTMRVPADVSATVNAYLAFRAALIAASEREVRSLIAPGLATGVGRMPPAVCATQMYAAYLAVLQPHFPARLGEATESHWLMLNSPRPRRGT